LQTGCALQLKPCVVPLQVPVRYCVEGHWVLEQVVQVPFLVEDAPLRNWLALHTGCALHVKPLVVPLQVPVRYCAEEHWALVQVVQVPLVVEDDPRRYWLVVQAGWMMTGALTFQQYE